MKARLPERYRTSSAKLKEQETRDFSRRLIQHICKGFIVVMYKKYGWRKKRCYELMSEVIDYLNNHYDEAEAEEIVQKLDLSAISNTEATQH